MFSQMTHLVVQIDNYFSIFVVLKRIIVGLTLSAQSYKRKNQERLKTDVAISRYIIHAELCCYITM